MQNRQIYRDRKADFWLPGYREEQGVTANGYRVSFWGDENVLKLTMLMVA